MAKFRYADNVRGYQYYIADFMTSDKEQVVLSTMFSGEMYATTVAVVKLREGEEIELVVG